MKRLVREVEEKRKAWVAHLDSVDRVLHDQTTVLAGHISAITNVLTMLTGIVPAAAGDRPINAVDDSSASARVGGLEEDEESESPEQRMARVEQLSRFPRVTTMGHSRKFREYCTQVIVTPVADSWVTGCVRLEHIHAHAHTRATHTRAHRTAQFSLVSLYIRCTTDVSGQRCRAQCVGWCVS